MSTTAQLGDSGITLGGSDTTGARWSWSGNSPWSPSPAPRSVTGENATDHGSWDATEYYGPRTFALEGYVQVASHEALHEAFARLSSVISLRGFDLRVIEPGLDRWARFRRDSELGWNEINPTTATFSVSIWANDPRIYSTTTRTASAAFPSSTGGLALPATFPLAFPATVTSGEMRMTNEGTEDAWPVYRIDGPITNPTIVNATTGQVMRLDIVLLAGQWITIDTGTHQVLADGDVNASRRNLFWGDWFGLTPGANTIRLGGDSAGIGAQLSATWRDTWL